MQGLRVDLKSLLGDKCLHVLGLLGTSLKSVCDCFFCTGLKGCLYTLRTILGLFLKNWLRSILVVFRTV